MFYRISQVALVAVLTCLAGINYTWYSWFDYKILGIGKGFLLHSLTTWGYVSMSLGLLMFGTLAFRKVINVIMIDKPLEIFMAIIFVIQLPVVSLWFMAVMMQGVEALTGVIMHSALLILIGYRFMTSHRTPRKQKDQQQEETSDLTL